MEQEAAVRAEGSLCSCQAEWVWRPLETGVGSASPGVTSPQPHGKEQPACSHSLQMLGLGLGA